MEKFFNLRAEKQEHIVNAAFSIFAHLGYKKTSTADIAAEAGIAKGMVFYYFGSKKNLYEYLVEKAYSTVIDEINKGLDRTITDFFDRLVMISNIKMALMKKNQNIMKFIASVNFETDKEVAGCLKKVSEENAAIRNAMFYEGVDVSKFKDGIDPKLIEKFLIWAGEGWVANLADRINMDEVEVFAEEYYKCLAIMKKHFYK